MEAPQERLAGNGIVLRRWRRTDAAELRNVVESTIDHLAPWTSWAVNGYGEREATEFLERTVTQWESGYAFGYAIVVDDAIAGSCGMASRDRGGFEIGYWLHLGYLGRGIATEATRLVVSEAFRIGAQYVEIRHDEHNERSSGIPRRLGFTEVGHAPARRPGGTASSGTFVVWRRVVDNP